MPITTRLEYKIRTKKGNCYIDTGVYDISSRLDKKGLILCCNKSLAHQKLIEIKKSKKKTTVNSSVDIPSTDGAFFRYQEFIHTVKCLVENLAYNGHDINEAIQLGNDIINGKIESKLCLPVWLGDYHKTIRQQAIEALFYRTKL